MIATVFVMFCERKHWCKAGGLGTICIYGIVKASDCSQTMMETTFYCLHLKGCIQRLIWGILPIYLQKPFQKNL